MERWNVSIRSTEASGSPNREAVAWYDALAVYIPAPRLREAAGNTLKEREIARILSDGGLIAKRKDADCSFVSHVKGVGKMKAYALSRREFGRTEEEETGLSFIPGGRQ
jgi:hypothetical protein